MSRPMYEVPADVDAQNGVLDALAAAWRCKWVPLPQFYEADAAMLRGRDVMAFVEVKCREVKHDEYPTLILAVHKWVFLAALKRNLNVPGVLAVRYTDGIWWMDVGEAAPPKIVFAGRTDRDDGQDMEPCVDIPLRAMRRLTGG